VVFSEILVISYPLVNIYRIL